MRRRRMPPAAGRKSSEAAAARRGAAVGDLGEAAVTARRRLSEAGWDQQVGRPVRRRAESEAAAAAAEGCRS